MKFTISKAPLVAALARCAAIAGSKSMAILDNCLITVIPAAIKLFATDLEVGYETAIEIRDPDFADCEFTSCLLAKKLHEIAKAMPISDVTIDIDAATHKFTISGGTFSTTLDGHDATDYPQPPIITGEPLAIPAAQLLEAIAPVAYCQSKDGSKPNLEGVWLKFEENHDGDVFITTAATDGHRLCLNTTPITGDYDSEPLDYIPALAKGIVIPSKAIGEILHLDTTPDDETPCPCVITIAENKLVLTVREERLTITLCGLEFPDVNRVIPQGTTGKIIIKRQALIDAITRVKIATDKENMRGINLDALEDRSGITLSATMPQQNIEATDQITAELINYPCVIPIRFCSDYLLQALGNMAQTQIELNFKDPLSPMLITPAGTDFPQAVVMPMRGA
ncbi:MAG: DNA polymerase III subunit beta [Desulfuromonadaceae bacterium]|nr:DNA polymerase III subunit beta [Desulfuromonadaceae bacterium]